MDAAAPDPAPLATAPAARTRSSSNGGGSSGTPPPPAGASAAAAAAANKSPQLRTTTLPSGLTLHVVSEVDAKLEAAANEEHQVYFGKGAVRLRKGAWVAVSHY